MTAHGGHVYGTDCQRQRKGLRDPSDVSEETESQRRGLPYPDSIPLSHTHVQLLLVPFLQDSPWAGARTPGPLGPLVGCRIMGAWSSPAPQCPGCTYGSIFPSPGLWTASPVPGLCSRPLILGWVSHMPRSPPAASLAPTHSQQRDGVSIHWHDPLARGGGRGLLQSSYQVGAQWGHCPGSPEGCMILQTRSVRSVGLPAS